MLDPLRGCSTRGGASCVMSVGVFDVPQRGAWPSQRADGTNDHRGAARDGTCPGDADSAYRLPDLRRPGRSATWRDLDVEGHLRSARRRLRELFQRHSGSADDGTALESRGPDACQTSASGSTTLISSRSPPTRRTTIPPTSTTVSRRASRTGGSCVASSPTRGRKPAPSRKGVVGAVSHVHREERHSMTRRERQARRRPRRAPPPPPAHGDRRSPAPFRAPSCALRLTGDRPEAGRRGPWTARLFEAGRRQQLEGAGARTSRLARENSMC